MRCMHLHQDLQSELRNTKAMLTEMEARRQQSEESLLVTTGELRRTTRSAAELNAQVKTLRVRTIRRLDIAPASHFEPLNCMSCRVA